MRLSAPLYQLKRRARIMARDQDIPLHAALDRVALEEGFQRWSLLSSRRDQAQSMRPLLPDLTEADIVLLGARPGHGKTRLGLRLLVEAIRDGRRAVFFTLEYTERESRERIRSLGSHDGGVGIEVVAADAISAASIEDYLSDAPRGTVVVVDYLQILDQQRSKPPLKEQMDALRRLAQSDGFIMAFVSQIDRSFDGEGGRLPSLADVRLPNPIDLTTFSKACFLHDGAIELHPVTG